MPRPKALPFSFLAVPLLLVASCVAPPRSAVQEPTWPQAHPVVDSGFDVQSYHLDLTLHATLPKFSGVTTVDFVTTRPVDSVTLHAADMEILEVLPQNAWKHDGRELTLSLGEVLPAGEQRSFRIRYRAAPLGGVHFALPGQNGLDHIPQMFTQGEDIRARFWFPCHDEPWDRARHTMSVTMPRSWTSVAAGSRTSREVLEGGLQVTESWSMPQDMPTYLFTLAAGPFLVLEDSWRDTPLWYIGEPGDEELLTASFAETSAVLEFLSRYTGFDYPYAKYAQVAVRDFPFGGMENVSATTVTRNALHPAHEQELTPSWGLVAHEAAHQWFGDTVTCETWAHAWLNEGFASYFTLLYREERNGKEDFLAAMGDTIDGYMRACQGVNLRPLVKDSFRLPMDIFFDGTIYPGGASRLQLLRGMLGEDMFREGIRQYLTKHAYQSVNSDDFRRAMEQASGKNLEPWFATWVYASGYPKLDIVPQRFGNTIELSVRQVQESVDGVPSVFPLPLEVRWSEGGEWQQLRFQVFEREESFLIPIEENYDGFLILDPDVLLPAEIQFHDGFDALRLRAEGSDRSRDRILAIRKLAKEHRQDPAVIELLWRVATQDAVPAVRRKAIAALRQSRQQGLSVARVWEARSQEPDAGVRLDWWRAYCELPLTAESRQHRQQALLDASLADVERIPALRALAAGKEPNAREAWLQQQLEKSGNPALQAEALNALRSLAKQEPARRQQLEALALPYSWRGQETKVRQAALRLLADGLIAIDSSAPTAQQQSVVDSMNKALLSWNAILRRSTTGLAAQRPELFEKAFRELDRREPDARVRQILRDATAERFEE